MFYFLPASRRETRAVIGREYLFTLCSANGAEFSLVVIGAKSNNGMDGRKSIQTNKTEQELPSCELDEIRPITALSLIVW